MHSLGDLVKPSFNSRPPGCHTLKHSITVWHFTEGLLGEVVFTGRRRTLRPTPPPISVPRPSSCLCNGEIPSLFQSREVPPTLRAPEVVTAYGEQ